MAATKTKPIGNDDDCRFTIIVNSASTAALIGLPQKMAEFCHTFNRSLLGHQCRRALLRLYFNSSATGQRLVGNKGCRALGGSLQKDNIGVVYFYVQDFLYHSYVIPVYAKAHCTNSEAWVVTDFSVTVVQIKITGYIVKCGRLCRHA